MRFVKRYLKRSRPENVTLADLRAFIAQGVEEHQTLEYKPRGTLVTRDDSIIRLRDLSDMSGFVSLAKSVSSLANAEGGLLVLGVKEKPEKIRGAIVKIRPGPLSPLPPTVSREMIENQLLSLIQYPIEGVTIVPIRVNRSKTIYLVDVPQSQRAPHRVAERFYYQRYNFSSLEMKHYQIADMFGQRRLPSLRLVGSVQPGAISATSGQNTFRGKILLSLANEGAGTAKSPFLAFTITGFFYHLSQGGLDSTVMRGWLG